MRKKKRETKEGPKKKKKKLFSRPTFPILQPLRDCMRVDSRVNELQSAIFGEFQRRSRVSGVFDSRYRIPSVFRRADTLDFRSRTRNGLRWVALAYSARSFLLSASTVTRQELQIRSERFTPPVAESEEAEVSPSLPCVRVTFHGFHDDCSEGERVDAG